VRHGFMHYIFLMSALSFCISLNACVEKPAIVLNPESISQSGRALQWSKTFGGEKDDKGRSVQQTTDGGYIICGITESSLTGYEDVWLIKTDAEGNKLWDKIFGGRNDDIGNSVQQTTDGGYIVCGNTYSYGAGDEDIWLIKTDADGKKLWDKTFGTKEFDVGLSAQQTIDGGYVACGGIYSEAGGLDVWLIKTDAKGNKLWDKTFGGKGISIGNSVQQTKDGSYIICGRTLLYGAENQYVWLIKTDANGNKLWDKTFGGKGISIGNSVQQTTDSGYIICGNTISTETHKAEVWLIKTDASGNKLWDKTFDNGYGNSAQQTADGGYIICGKIFSNETSGKASAWLVKTDDGGNKLWDETFNGKGDTEGYSVQQTKDGGYIICGEAYYGEVHSYDILLLKIAPEQ
jgi:hypothetical protein